MGRTLNYYFLALTNPQKKTLKEVLKKAFKIEIRLKTPPLKALTH